MVTHSWGQGGSGEGGGSFSVLMFTLGKLAAAAAASTRRLNAPPQIFRTMRTLDEDHVSLSLSRANLINQLTGAIFNVTSSFCFHSSLSICLSRRFHSDSLFTPVHLPVVLLLLTFFFFYIFFSPYVPLSPHSVTWNHSFSPPSFSPDFPPSRSLLHQLVSGRRSAARPGVKSGLRTDWASPGVWHLWPGHHSWEGLDSVRYYQLMFLAIPIFDSKIVEKWTNGWPEMYATTQQFLLRTR